MSSAIAAHALRSVAAVRGCAALRFPYCILVMASHRVSLHGCGCACATPEPGAVEFAQTLIHFDTRVTHPVHALCDSHGTCFARFASVMQSPLQLFVSFKPLHRKAQGCCCCGIVCSARVSLQWQRCRTAFWSGSTPLYRHSTHHVDA
jgi:hypothetical protein